MDYCIIYKITQLLYLKFNNLKYLIKILENKFPDYQINSKLVNIYKN